MERVSRVEEELEAQELEDVAPSTEESMEQSMEVAFQLGFSNEVESRLPDFLRLLDDWQSDFAAVAFPLVMDTIHRSEQSMITFGLQVLDVMISKDDEYIDALLGQSVFPRLMDLLSLRNTDVIFRILSILRTLVRSVDPRVGEVCLFLPLMVARVEAFDLMTFDIADIMVNLHANHQMMFQQVRTCHVIAEKCILIGT